jgi:ABC-type lipoprotein release transport system permease subunit
MNLWRLVENTLRHYWRTNLAVLAAVAVGTGVLTGALAVGDSVRHTLERTMKARLGDIEYAVLPQGRFFRAALADDLEEQLAATVASVLQVQGIITNADGSERVNRIRVLGVTEKFYTCGPGENPFHESMSEAIVLSEAVARRLGVGAGAEVVLRMEKPGMMPRDVPLASDRDRTVASRLKVLNVASKGAFGRFDLRANQTPALSVFVPYGWLSERIEQPGRANMLLAARLGAKETAGELDDAVEEAWQLADAGLELRRLEREGVLELRSRRIFIDDVLGDAALELEPNASGVLTYFVNEIRLGDKSTPYSMVAAVDGRHGVGGVLPDGTRNDEMVINQWLADDLGAEVGDSVELAYYRVGPKRKLYESRGRFKVVRIVPVEGSAHDPNLMPDFPGLADAENCRDWEPGIPIDLDKIRPKDERYWDDYRGTPKAFITREAGQASWRNQYGNLTAVRYPWKAGLAEKVADRLTKKIDPGAVGLYFQPVYERGRRAGRQGTDFGGLFLGLSMFLIAAAVILTGLLFVFGVESRSEQVGMLMAVGWPARRVKRLLLVEGTLVAALGAVAGVGVGLLYTRLVIQGLATAWSGAVSGSAIEYHVEFFTLLVGAFTGLAVALLAIWFTLRRHVTRPARQLMAGNLEEDLGPRSAGSRGIRGLTVAAVCFSGVGVFLTLGAGRDSQAAAGAFFGAGALLLLGMLGVSQAVLRVAGGGWSRPMVSLGGLGLRNATRRRGRSLAIIGLLACGVFMVLGVQAFRRHPLRNPWSRDSGTGGFAFYGESSVPILHDLGEKAGRGELGLDEEELADVDVVQFRVHEGDDASCLNLNRAQRPRLLGVLRTELQQRRAFSFAETIPEADADGWDLLSLDLDNGVVPAIADASTVKWGLGQNIGGELEYNDERGRGFRVRIVGIIEDSVLQGNLIIAENEFVARFPSTHGYRVLLVDAPVERASDVAREFSAGLTDYGMVLTPTPERQAAFSAVQNTYLSVFTLLGGLGLVLGSVGLGLIVVRNMLERRPELGMLRAVGFDRARVRRLVFYEHWGLMLAGLFCGIVAAITAVVPVTRSQSEHVSYVWLLVIVIAMGINGALWVWLAATLALRGRLLEAIRSE